MYIWYNNKDGIFLFRIVGLLMKNNKILVQRGVHDDAYALPGGHVEMFERSEDTLIREFKEEMNVEIIVERLLWIQEHMSEWNGRQHHSLCFYYLIDINDSQDLPLDGIFYSQKGNDSEIEFSWVDIDKVKDMNFYPIFIREKLSNLPTSIERFVEQEIQNE